MMNEEIKRALNHMDISTARNRALMHGRAISIVPDAQEIEVAARERAKAYMDAARQLAENVQVWRTGLPDTELERIELVREELYSLSRDVLTDIVAKG